MDQASTMMWKRKFQEVSEIVHLSKDLIVIELLLRGFIAKSLCSSLYLLQSLIMPIEGNTYLTVFRYFFSSQINVLISLLISHNVYFCTMNEENTTIKKIYFDLYYLTSFIMDPASSSVSSRKWHVSYINLSSSSSSSSSFFFFGGGGGGFEVYNRYNGEEQSWDTGPIQGTYKRQQMVERNRVKTYFEPIA